MSGGGRTDWGHPFYWRLAVGIVCLAISAVLLSPVDDPFARPQPRPGAAAEPYEMRVRIWADELLKVQIQQCTLRVISRYEEVCVSETQARQRSMSYRLAEIDPAAVAASSDTRHGAVLIGFRPAPEVGWFDRLRAGYLRAPERRPGALVITEYCEPQSAGSDAAPLPLPPGGDTSGFALPLSPPALPFYVETGPRIREIAVPAEHADMLATVIAEAARACAPG